MKRMRQWFGLLGAAVLLVAGSYAGDAVRQVQSLDGAWEIIFDEANEGREAGWSKKATFSKHDGRRAIEVPSCWELIEQDYEGASLFEVS